MYGLVNQAIKDLVLAKFGEKSWDQICTKVGLPPTDFVSMQYYPDAITYGLVGAASSQLGIPAETILSEFGKHWVQYTAKEGYGPLMDLFGADFKSCLQNLNNLHGRMGMTMPDLAPPRFSFTEISADTYHLEYQSKRDGLVPMVTGLLQGLASKYQVKAEISFLADTENTGKKIFQIKVLG